MDFSLQARARQDEMIQDLQTLIRINSVLDEKTMSEDAPFGKGPKEALQWMLQQGQMRGMRIRNMANKVGYIEMGQGDEMVGILCHVDVVPAGSDWTYAPFGAEIDDGKLYGRGAIDDKGPTMAAWLAMKMVQESGVKLQRRVRMIVGSDEETGFRCVKHYFENEEAPTLGFAPDADFPIINAEKGIAEVIFKQKQVNSGDEQLIDFQAGHRMNMVPDFAKAVVTNVATLTEAAFQNYLNTHAFTGTFEKINGNITLTLKGKSAHAMEPDAGINAALHLAQFLAMHITTAQSKTFIDFLTIGFAKESRGHALNLNFTDEMSGDTTLNAGVISYTNELGGHIEVSMRYSVSYPFEEKIAAAKQIIEAFGFDTEIQDNSAPHFVDPQSELIQKLSKVYERNTGEKTELIAIGGGTYAREMKNGVAFGMLFPGEPDIAHQADEFVVIENLVKAAAIYADAIIELATK